MMSDAYIAGFRKKAESVGINPDLLLKVAGFDKKAFWPLLLGLSGLAAGGIGYGIYKNRHPRQSELAPMARRDYMLKNAPKPSSYGNIKAINNINNQTALNSLGSVL